MPVVIFCGWHNTLTGEHAVAGIGCTWLILWGGIREPSLLVLALSHFWEALFFGPFKATVIVRRVSRIVKIATVSFIVSCLSVRWPVCVKRLGSCGTDSHEI